MPKQTSTDAGSPAACPDVATTAERGVDPDAAAAATAWALLACAIAGRPRVRVSRDGGRTYPAGCERALTAQLPDQPAAVLLYDAAGASACLAADFDVKRGGGRAQVDRDAAAFTALVAACGGHSISDISPNGGRHVYVLWARPIPIADMRPAVRALAALYPSLDPTPMLNPSAGCIRPPGARHRSGGHQMLTTALPAARAALAHRCGPNVWAQLLDRLAPHLHTLDALGLDGHPDAEVGEAAVTGAAAGTRGRLPARVVRIAQTGLYDTDRYTSPSEARQAVITAAAAAGWSLADVEAQISGAHWPGLASFYARYRSPARRRALGRDWRKAQTHLEQKKNDRSSPTRGWTHTGGPLVCHSERSSRVRTEPGIQDEYGWIRSWWNAVSALERTSRWTGRSALSTRMVLRALGAMAQMRGTRHLDVGRRGLALACGLDDSTVGTVLRALRAEDDPVIELLEADRGERADLYVLRIPDAALEAAAWRTWRPGRIGVHPVFRVLGPAAALAFEALTVDPLPRRDVIRDTALHPHTLDGALRILAEQGLAENLPGQGWRRGQADLERLAQALGVTEIITGLVARYRHERAAWRAYLEARAHRGHSPAVEPGTPLWWPAHVSEPPCRDAADELYDLNLAHVALEAAGALDEAIDLLQRELGATFLARSGSRH